jgi:hypothetical protein
VRLVEKLEKSATVSELLGQALLTPDLYLVESDSLENGHLQWAVEILKDQNLWSAHVVV